VEKFIANMRALYGENGQVWLDSLPQPVEFLAHEWDLSSLKPFLNLMCLLRSAATNR